MEKITYKDIEGANSKLISTDIKGKPYMEVNQRIKAFRMVYPQGSIPTEIISINNGVVIMKASVYTDDGKLLATGTAYEKEGSTFINKTSHIENCETSAVGRALGIAGFGIDTSIASAEEVGNAIANQDDKKENKLVTPSQLKIISTLDKNYINKCLNKLEINSVVDLTIQQASEIISKKLNR